MGRDTTVAERYLEVQRKNFRFPTNNNTHTSGIRNNDFSTQTREEEIGVALGVLYYVLFDMV